MLEMSLLQVIIYPSKGLVSLGYLARKKNSCLIVTAQELIVALYAQITKTESLRFLDLVFSHCT